MDRDERVDAYLAQFPEAQRAALERLRRQIASVIPGAVETISYGMPAYRLGDRFFISYAGWKHHCSVYPLTRTFLAAHGPELEGFARTKGSLHFTPEAPLPAGLVEDLVRSRLADVESGRR
jgi:uncharacterized protein YdhG (YjbR/CyaY superfamily)